MNELPPFSQKSTEDFLVALVGLFGGGNGEFHSTFLPVQNGDALATAKVGIRDVEGRGEAVAVVVVICRQQERGLLS